MKLGDPSDKLDAQADGNFGGKHNTNRRAGYSKTVTINGEEITELEWLIRRAKKDHTLASGEGRKLVEHYEERLAALEAERDSQAHKASVFLRDWLRCAEANTAYSKERDQWRVRVETAELERDTEKQRRKEIDDEAFVYAEQVEVMRRRAHRAERILANLRDPSEAVKIAVQEAVEREALAPCYYREAEQIVRAAVAAAEKEVES